MPRPRKLKEPFKLDDWLRLALPDKRIEHRWKIFREWRRLFLQQNLKREPTDNELEREIKKWRSIEFYHSNVSANWMYTLRHDFLPEYRKAKRIQRASIAAKASWSPKGRLQRKKLVKKREEEREDFFRKCKEKGLTLEPLIGR